MNFRHLSRFLPFSQMTCRTGFRMASTIVGDSGRVYVKSDVLQRNREDDNLSIFKAEYVLNSVCFSPISSNYLNYII